MNAHASTEIVPVYVWELPVRVTHWLIALSMAVLAVTGFYIGRPFIIASGPAGERFVMGTVKVIHFYAAIAFTLAVLARVAWMFLGNVYARWTVFVPTSRTRFGGFAPTFLYYLLIRRRPPAFVGHNPLAGISYLVIFGLYVVEILTGLAMYGVSAAAGSPLRWFAGLEFPFGGLQMARWLHHATMWVFAVFVIHHVYSSVLWSIAENTGTMESIFSGFKFVPRADLVESDRGLVGRRDING